MLEKNERVKVSTPRAGNLASIGQCSYYMLDVVVWFVNDVASDTIEMIISPPTWAVVEFLAAEAAATANAADGLAPA